MMVCDYNCEFLGLSRLCLMESAGKSLAEETGKIAVYTFAKPVKIVIFTGSGGNGGDGFVAARYLLNRGYDVDIYMLKDNIHSKEARINLDILNNMKPRLSHLNIHNLKTLEDINNCEVLKNPKSEYIIVDALLGTGIKGELQKNIKRAIEIINELNGIKISVDVPSGMDPLTGEVYDLAVVPDYTICFHKIKTGVRQAKEEIVGGLVTSDIGIPFEAEYYVNYGDFLRFKNRKTDSHKGKNGRILIVGGSEDYSGAPAISALASISSGADLVYVATPSPAAPSIKALSPDLIVKELKGDNLSVKHSEEILELAKKVDAVLLGPGAGISEDTSNLLNTLAVKIKKPLVLDADSLKQVNKSLVEKRKDIILTPHIYEFKSFFDIESELKLDIDSFDFKKVDENITEFQNIARKVKASIIVKGKNDLILSGNKFRINKSGNAGMTVGGTGDALSGICTSLLAQGLSPFDAACLGVFINGLAGEEAFNDKGYSFSASEMIGYIGTVIKNGLC